MLNFIGCKDVTLRSMDLYGCGVYGIFTDGGTRNLYVNDTVIRDCEDGPFLLWECRGEIKFTDCRFIGSDGPGSIPAFDEGSAEVSFVRCTFGKMERNFLNFEEQATFEDCKEE